MNIEEKALENQQISSIHAKELDDTFDTFDYGGLPYHNVGLLQAWVRGYTNPNLHMTTEPPQWTEEFLGWLNEHKCEIKELMVGPPVIKFPNKETAEAFKLEWHEKSRERYPYAEMKAFLEESKLAEEKHIASQKQPWDERGWKPD